MPNPTPGDIHINRLLTDFSVAYAQNPANYIAEQVFPSHNVMKQSDLYAVWSREELLRVSMVRRARATASPTMDYLTSTDTYFCDKFSVKVAIDDDQRRNADDQFDLDRQATNRLVQQDLTLREIEFNANFMVTGKWDIDKDGGTIDFVQWDDGASTPIEDMVDFKLEIAGNTGFTPNVLVLDALGWGKLKTHADILARITGGSTTGDPAAINMRLVAELFELDRIVVSSAIQNTSTTGESYSRIAGKHGLLLYVSPDTGLETPTAGKTFVWSNRFGAQDGRTIKKWRDENIESDYVEINSTWDMKITGADLGMFLENIIA